MIGGVKLQWWLALIAFGGVTVIFGASLIKSGPFMVVGGIMVGFALGVHLAHGAALRAVAIGREGRHG